MKQVSFLIMIMLVFFSTPMFGQLKAYTDKLNDFRYTKYLDSSIFYFKKALPIAVQNKDSVAIFMLNKRMGDAFEHHQQLDKTLRYYAICDRYIPYKNLKLKSFLINDMAYTYTLLHDYDQATKLTLKALKIAELSQNQKEIALVSITVAEGFSNLNLDAQANEYFVKGIKIAEKINSDPLLEYANRYYAVFLLKTKKTDLAIIRLRTSLTYATKNKDTISQAFNYQQLSIYYWQKKQYQKCFEFAKKAEKIWENRAENRDLASICVQIGSYYLEQKQFEQAEFYLKKAEKYLLDDLYFNENLFTNLSLLYKQTNQIDAAFDYLLKAKTTLEKIKDREGKSKVAKLRIQFEADKKEIEIQKQKQQNQVALLREEKSKSRFSILVVFLCFLIMAIAFVAYYLKEIKIKNQQLKQSNRTLEKYAEQKKILLQEVHHRVKNNLTTLKSLFYLQSKSTANEELKNILVECELRIDSMALIHQSLYENGESDGVDLQLFIENLFESLQNTYRNEKYSVLTNLDVTTVPIKLSRGIYIGLIINELATNSYKYAFEGKESGTIDLKIAVVDSKFQIIYSDSGIGIKNFQQQKEGFGLKLIGIMTKQLNATMDYAFKNGNSQFIITFDEV